MPNLTGGYSYMTSEELLNGIYLLASYAIVSDDEPWSRTRLATATELLDSLEARDHVDPAKRTGILKAESSICGPAGREITTYDSLDASLKPAHGSLVLAIKTWCATLMLTAYFQQHNDEAAAQRTYNFSHLTATAIAAAFDEATQSFPANLFTKSDARILALFEPMAVPAYCNLKHYFAEFPDLMTKLKAHAQTCLRPGICLDSTTGGMKLSSTSPITYPSKIALVIWVLENILDIPFADYPNALAELTTWSQQPTPTGAYADQINTTTRHPLGGTYSPPRQRRNLAQAASCCIANERICLAKGEEPCDKERAMSPTEFARKVEAHVRDVAVKSTVSNLLKPPGRQPSPELMALSRWYLQLSPTDQKWY